MSIAGNLKKLKKKAVDSEETIVENKKKLNFQSMNVNSLWVFHYDGSGCDGCNAEYLACLGPAWDIERLGIRNTGNPTYADVLLVTGLVDETNKEELLEIYQQTREGCCVIAAGACACTGGMFSTCDHVLEGADNIIPVDIYAAGCAVRPQCIIDALMMIRAEKNGEVEDDEQ